MADPRELARPPIVEALIDFRIATKRAITRDDLQPIVEGLQSEFPKAEEKRSFHAEFRVEAGKMIPPSAEDLGFQNWTLSAADGQRTVQLRTDGITLNHVGAYKGGEALLDDALRLWNLFTRTIHPDFIARLAMRYINRLDLPLHYGDEFSKFLTSPPQMPPGAPQDISSFLSRIVAMDDSGAATIVLQRLDGGTEAPVPLFIDIDVFFAQQEMEPTDQVVRRRLEQLRALKNRCFFALLTEETVSLFI